METREELIRQRVRELEALSTSELLAVVDEYFVRKYGSMEAAVAMLTPPPLPEEEQ